MTKRETSGASPRRIRLRRAFESQGVGRLAPVLAVDHGGHARQTGGEDGVERPPVPGVDDIGPEPPEEAGESHDGPQIEAGPLGHGVDRHVGGQPVRSGPPAVMRHDGMAETAAGRIDDVDDAVLDPADLARESSTWTTWITGRATAAPIPRSRAGPRSGWIGRGHRA